MKSLTFWLLVFVLWNSELGAQAPFFHGKTIRIVVGYPAGISHDQWARLIAPHLSKYLPGNPAVIVQNMTGAGSMVAANYVYGVAKPDGLTLGVVNAALYFEQLLGHKEIQFDWSKFAWIGSSTRAITCRARAKSSARMAPTRRALCPRPRRAGSQQLIETVALSGHYSLVGLVVNGFDVPAPQGSVTF